MRSFYAERNFSTGHGTIFVAGAQVTTAGHCFKTPCEGPVPR